MKEVRGSMHAAEARRYNDFHAPAGADGGQFTSGGSGGGKTAPTPKTTGKGGKPHGSGGHATAKPAEQHSDARVHSVQQALNRLGVKDQHGKPLLLDGVLGPRTTSAVKSAQKQLGLPVDGKITPALLARLKAAKSLPHRSIDMPNGDQVISRAQDIFVRSFQLQNIAVRSGGDGRTVEAYAAVFDTPAEILDGQGHYHEVIDRAAFNRTIANNAQRVGVFYNHGMNLYATPSDRFSIPIGTPEEIRADGRGLLTVTRYNNTPQADEVLEAIRSGGIAGYSFTGRLIRSDPNRPPAGGFGRGRDGALRTVRRHELGLSEYGPTPMPAYNEAAIVGVRAALGAELRTQLSSTPGVDPDGSTDTSLDGEPVADDPREHSVRQSPFARRLQVALTARGMRSDVEAAGHPRSADGHPVRAAHDREENHRRHDVRG